MKTWDSTSAKQHFSNLIEGSKTAPQLIERRGKPVSVIISYETFIKSEKLNEKQNTSAWLKELQSINKHEDEMPDITRKDRIQPDWE